MDAVGVGATEQRAELEKRVRAALKPRVFSGLRGTYLLSLVLAWAALLGTVGRAWPVSLLALALAATSALIVAARIPDWWQARWFRLWQWALADGLRWASQALGVDPPDPLTSDWLDGRPPGTVPDRIRAWVLTAEGKLAEAKVIAERLPADTPLDRYRRAVAMANIDLMAGRPADYADARRELPALEKGERMRARNTLAHNEFLAAFRAGRPLRELPQPDTSHMRFGIRDRLRLLRWRIAPLDWFAGLFAGSYLAMSFLGLVMGGIR